MWAESAPLLIAPFCLAVGTTIHIYSLYKCTCTISGKEKHDCPAFTDVQL